MYIAKNIRTAGLLRADGPDGPRGRYVAGHKVPTRPFIPDRRERPPASTIQITHMIRRACSATRDRFRNWAGQGEATSRVPPDPWSDRPPSATAPAAPVKRTRWHGSAERARQSGRRGAAGKGRRPHILGVLVRAPGFLRASGSTSRSCASGSPSGSSAGLGQAEAHGLCGRCSIRWSRPWPTTREPPGRILPVYPATEGLRSGSSGGWCAALEAYAGLLEEVFPAEYLAGPPTVPIRQALPRMHFPGPAKRWRRPGGGSSTRNCSSCNWPWR